MLSGERDPTGETVNGPFKDPSQDYNAFELD
jgi:hypothetical protein